MVIYFPNISLQVLTNAEQKALVNAFKKAAARPIYKKDERTEKSNYKPISVLLDAPKSMKDGYTSKCILKLIKYFLRINAVFVKTLILNISF